MKILDGDEQRIRNSSGQLASRDLVQFVPMRDFETRGAMALAKEVSKLLLFFTNNYSYTVERYGISDAMYRQWCSTCKSCKYSALACEML
jgi:predicted alpha/beta hydrolase